MSTTSSTSAFATAVGGDVKALYTLITGAASITSLTNLNTNTKANLVAAINEVLATANGAAAGGIDDSSTSTSKTWSSSKINTQIGAVASQVQTILAGSTAAYDTFKEVSDYIASDQSGAAAMMTSIQNRIQTDADQTFTAAQITQGLANLVKLGVAKQTDLAALTTTVSNLVTAVGDTTTNFVTVYNTAKNS